MVSPKNQLQKSAFIRSIEISSDLSIKHTYLFIMQIMCMFIEKEKNTDLCLFLL